MQYSNLIGFLHCLNQCCMEMLMSNSGVRPICLPASALVLNIPTKVVQDGLPTLALEFGRVFGFRVETDGHENAVGALGKLDLGFTAVAHPVFDEPLRYDAGVGAFEVEAFAAVLRFHTRQELATFAQIDGAAGRVPVILSRIPSFDVRGIAVGIPDLAEIGLYASFHGDFHGALLWIAVALPCGRTGKWKFDTVVVTADMQSSIPIAIANGR